MLSARRARAGGSGAERTFILPPEDGIYPHMWQFLTRKVHISGRSGINLNKFYRFDSYFILTNPRAYDRIYFDKDIANGPSRCRALQAATIARGKAVCVRSRLCRKISYPILCILFSLSVA